MAGVRASAPLRVFGFRGDTIAPVCAYVHRFRATTPTTPTMSMNPNLRDRILRKLDTMSDERGYQVLDYVEFLETKYAEKPAPVVGVFRQFAEGIEDTLRAGRVSASAISETMSFMNKAVGVLEGVAAAGKSVANDVVTAARRAATPADGGAGTTGGTAVGTTPGATPPSSDPSAAGAPPTPPTTPGAQPS